MLDSWRQDGENSEKTAKSGAKMGEIWPKKRSAGCPSKVVSAVAEIAELKRRIAELEAGQAAAKTG